MTETLQKMGILTACFTAPRFPPDNGDMLKLQQQYHSKQYIFYFNYNNNKCQVLLRIIVALVRFKLLKPVRKKFAPKRHNFSSARLKIFTKTDVWLTDANN